MFGCARSDLFSVGGGIGASGRRRSRAVNLPCAVTTFGSPWNLRLTVGTKEK